MVAMITCREDIPNLYKDQLKNWTKTGEVYCARTSACGTPFENVCYLLIYDRIFYFFSIITKSKNNGVFTTFAS